MKRNLHRSAQAEMYAAHNEGFVLGVAAMLRVMREHGPTGWWRFYRANLALELPDGTKVMARDLIENDAPRMAPSPEMQQAWIRETEKQGG